MRTSPRQAPAGLHAIQEYLVTRHADTIEQILADAEHLPDGPQKTQMLVEVARMGLDALRSVRYFEAHRGMREGRAA